MVTRAALTGLRSTTSVPARPKRLRPPSAMTMAAADATRAAKELEDLALSDDYFIQRKLYPNVDFYSGIIYRAMGFPTDMFPVLFALGRLPGWLAQYREMAMDPATRIYRPQQLYSGAPVRDYLPIEQRKS